MTETEARDPQRILDDNPMNWRQFVVVGLMVALNALDGFDVLSSAFASPGISKEWGVPREALGVMLSAELVGMGFGSVILGGLADTRGRKLTMLACLVIMAIGMYFAHAAAGVTELSIWRFITGLGIGGMLTATNAVTAESTSKAGRSIAMAIYVIGYPLGGVIGGLVAQTWLLPHYDWRAVFLFGAVVTAAMIPLVALLVPETPAFFTATRPADAVTRINRALTAFGKPPISALPQIEPGAPKPKLTDILSNPRLRPVTLLLAFGYMFHTITFYYILKWAVKIVSDYPPGYAPPEAASVLTFANIGGALGGLLLGFLMKRWSIKGPTVAMLALAIGTVTLFGLGYGSLDAWRAAAFAAMFFGNGAIVGFYSAFALGFPAFARGTGTGFVLGVGRLGAAGSPIIAGYLFKAFGNDQLLLVSFCMALGSLAALVLFLLLPMRDGDAEMAARG
ncbi:MFS transporter [Novosphingobium sp. B 225]|uniref:MFS transporter n=1 Tax=Novosphingobium sp. B 225 TaxID=1961849 RepID=UPI00159542B4|nr:MFS transporter [Novosphingobium sp. B 225]